MIVKLLPDETDRRRIVEDLHLSFLVEAGAGSGKTRSLVDRMVALLTTDRDEIRAEVEELAAVTFTRKAASELRERFQTRLEEELREARDRDDGEVAHRLDTALRQIDRAFLGTIHSFCGRLLRERPFEAGLDPAFREVVPPESEEQRKRFWHRFLETEHAGATPELARLREVGVGPQDLYDCFCTLDDRPDVPFPAEAVERPEAAAVRQDFERLLDRAERLMPGHEPEKGWDDLQRAIRKLRFQRRGASWENDATFFEGLASVVDREVKLTQYKWMSDKVTREAVKDLQAEFVEFGKEGGPAHAALERWYAHRYPAVIAFARKAAEQYEKERRQTGRLGFQDLLMQAARLLRESTPARRDLGGRYRYLLVDEFQDTDPIQAEVIFLLTAADPEVVRWQEAIPRPGALFVVGDPKQSIYRFTRADIAVYGLARRRFEAFRAAGVGDLLSLTANFRSTPPIEQFVNDEFRRRFPDQATDQQAAFAPMQVDREAGPDQGVFRYVVDAKRAGSRGPVTDRDVAFADAEGVAAWIQGQVALGVRQHGDFLILSYRKDYLGHYARALEARNIPVEVTGGKLMVEEELAEFRLLLEALLDPDDPVRTVAVLIGLFFGLDYEILTRHALAGGSFRLRQIEGQPEGSVKEALATMNRWWRLARSSPADVSVRTILDELGLLPFAAAGELGAPRAGALEFFLDVVREAGVAGDTSLRGAVEALDVALATEEAVAPLQPGRVDVVRVMNLHKAKGTESPVVILAHPAGKYDHAPMLRVERDTDGSARGTMEVSLRGNKPGMRTVIARPIDWRTEHQPKEKEFEEAEGDRLLYVAATRARDELLVSRCHGKEKRSLWEPFYGSLDEKWPLRTLEGPPRPERKTMARSAETIRMEIETLESERATRRAPSYVVGSVSARVKKDAAALEKGVGGRGRDWGSAVHQALEAAGRGLDGEALAAACRTALVSNRRPVEADGTPRELDELVALVGAVADSDLVRRARRAEHALFEVPFALPYVPRALGTEMAAPGSNRRGSNRRATISEMDAEQGDLFSADGSGSALSPEVAPPGLRLTEADEAPVVINGVPLEVVEGVIDLAFREAAGWVIADYKTDVVEDETILGARGELYRTQVDLYADCWERLTGEPVVERALLFTSTGRMEAWRDTRSPE